MNLLIKGIKIRKALKAKSEAGRNSSRLKSIREYVWKTWLASCTQRFSILFSHLDFCFLSSRILQNNLLHLYLVKIRLCKLSFFAKPATKSLPHFSAQNIVAWRKLITYRGLELAKSICAPNLEAIGSNAKFCEFISFYKITEIVRALWLAERRVCMRVCKHGCDVKMFCFPRANIWKRFWVEKLDKFTLFTHFLVGWNLKNL